MKKHLFLILLFLTAATCLQAQDDAWHEKMHNKLGFLAGDWKSESTYVASGLKVEGHLVYEWVEGEAWLRCTFVGKHPEYKVWESHEMIKWDKEKKKYLAYTFSNRGEMVLYQGELVDENRIRFWIEREGIRQGLDYIQRSDGSVHQENWIITPSGERRVWLKTEYFENKGEKTK